MARTASASPCDKVTHDGKQASRAAYLSLAITTTLALAAAACLLPQSVAFAGTAGLGFVVAMAVRPSPRLVTCVGLLLVMCSVSSPVLNVDEGAPSITLRVVGAALVVSAGLMTDSGPRPAWTMMVRTFVPGLGLYIVSSTLPFGEVTNFVLLSASLALLTAFVVAIGRIPSSVIGRAVTDALLIFVSGSLVAGFMTPADAIEQGRLRGLAENANGLGCYAFLLAALALTWRRSRALTAVCLVVSGTAIVWTGSRNTALAVIVVAVLLGLSSLRGRLTVVVAALGVALTYPLVSADVTTVFGRLVTGDNTRAETFSYAIDVFTRYPWTGIGLNNQLVEVASSPMRASVNAGVWGALAVALMWIALICVGHRAGRRAFAFAAGCVVFSVFEGTLLSPLGAGLFLTLAALSAVAEPPTQSAKQVEEMSHDVRRSRQVSRSFV